MAVMLSVLGCDDGKLHVAPSLADNGSDLSPDLSRDTSTSTALSDSSATDTGVDGGSDSDGTDSAGNVAVFTVKMQAENMDSLNFKASARQWEEVNLDAVPDTTPDPDESHAASAHGEAYMEALPDENAGDGSASAVSDPAVAAEMGYDVQLEVPGRYFVWVRGWTTDGQDCRIHVGLDGAWPVSGRSLRLPDAAGEWVWSSNQEGSGGMTAGIPLSVYLDVKTAGVHRVTFAMYDDGFEFDEWVATTDASHVP